MIKITNTETFGWESAIRGMRNPMNSWAKGDTNWEKYRSSGDINRCLGENDLKLMKTLSKAGSDHGKYLRYLTVHVDIEAPLYWWKEFKTYRKDKRFLDDGDDFLDIEDFDHEELELFIETNSCSTMHKIHANPFTLEDFSHEHLLEEGMYHLSATVGLLNFYREKFIETKDKQYWWQMIQLLPSSYNQKRTVQINYQVLKRMYHARKNHKLNEWHDFCDWVESLPYIKKICIED